MLRGLYTAASGMMTTMVQTDTLANNLANINTTGFKKNSVNFQSFPEMLLNRVSQQGSTAIGSVMTGSKVRSTYINFDQGNIVTSSRDFDFALEGDGFFTVKDPATNETRYTRNGNFVINPDGFLTTTGGELVQGNLGNIVIPQDTQVTLSQRGELTDKNGQIDSLTITRFKNNHLLEKHGYSQFRATSEAEKLPPPSVGEPLGYKTHQKMLEASNTNPISELINTITGQRLYEALQKNIQIQNQTLGQAVQEVGRFQR
ncbi:MAG: flagellar hook-basal body protein [Vampirovibrio sp.]|nr:flagellar hook-basal body protein [Vampirovibrio sp.]